MHFVRIKANWSCYLLLYSGSGFAMGSRSATTSPTSSVHSTPTHQTKPNTLDPFADIGNLGSSFGGPTPANQKGVCSRLFLLNVALCSGRFGLLQQTHHADWTRALHATHGLPVPASSVPPTRSLPVVAAQCSDRGGMAATRPKPRPSAKAQP